ncbi:MAG TPA: glycogen-binding domain-containing protein, partial [Gemmatimonadales bacterium]|nr:glycogen-binding domain-containing protein [Gemmatimonadales bacterium]
PGRSPDGRLAAVGAGIARAGGDAGSPEPRPALNWRRMRLTAGRSAGLLVPWLFAGSAAEAQRWQVDLGATSVRYDSTASVASAIVAPTLEWSRPTLYALLSGGLAAFEGAEWTAQGRGDVSYLRRPFRGGPVRFEFAASGGGSVHATGYRTAATRGEVRLHLAARRFGVWGGGAGATGWTSGSRGIAVGLGPTAGVWGDAGPWNAAILWNPLRIEGSWFPEVNGRLAATLGRLDLMAYGGWRGAAQGSGVAEASWGGGTAAWWLTRQVALTVAAGTYPSDLLQSLPGGRYLSVSIRLSSRRPSVWRVPTTGRAVYAADRGLNELRFSVPGASRVAIVGDWTAWQPVPMARDREGRWVIRVTLAPGVYRFNLVVDGERWIVPEDVAAVDDGFGGKTGMLVVP